MLYRNLFLKYYAPAGEGEQGGAGGVEITPEIQAIIDQQVADQVSGLKNKNNSLIGSEKALKEKLAAFEGIDPVAVRSILQRFSNDEEAKLISEGKIDEVLTKRTDRMRGDFDTKLKAANERADKAEGISKRYCDRVLGDSIRSAALKAGALPGATDDFIFRSKGMFTLGEDGEAVAVDKDGNVMLGKDGKSPLSPLEWAESLKEVAPHLWAAAAGTGAGEHKNGGTGALDRAKMTQTQKNEYIRTNGRESYLRLPKSKEQ